MDIFFPNELLYHVNFKKNNLISPRYSLFWTKGTCVPALAHATIGIILYAFIRI